MVVKGGRRLAQIALLTAVFLTLTTIPIAETLCNLVTGPVPNSPNYTWLIPVYSTGKSVIFNVKVASNFITALVANKSLSLPSESKYILKYGASSNTINFISREKSTKPPMVTYNFTGLLDNTKFVTLWASWSGNVIATGTGPIAGQNTIMSYYDPSPSPVNYILIGGYAALGTVVVNYCYAPRVFDRTLPIDAPTVNDVTLTDLDCGRRCEDDPKCQGYAVERGVSPVAMVECSIFYLMTGLQFSDQVVTYVVRNYTYLV